MNNNIHSNFIRSRHNIYLSKIKTNRGKQGFVYQAAYEWNTLHESIRDCQSVELSKSRFMNKLPFAPVNFLVSVNRCNSNSILARPN